MKVPIEDDSLSKQEIELAIKKLIEANEEHFLCEDPRCNAEYLRTTLLIEKLAKMLPTEPTANWLDEWRESWERSL